MDLTTLQKIEAELDKQTDKNELEYSAKTMADIIKRYQSQNETNNVRAPGGGALSASRTDDVNMDIINMLIVITDKEQGEIYDVDGLRNVVKKLLQIEAKLEEYNKVSKKLRTLKTSFRQKIREFMTLNDYEELSLPVGGYLTIKNTSRRLNVYTKKRIPDVLNGYFMTKKGMNSADAAQQTKEILAFFDESAVKNKTETKTLRRTK